MSIDEIRLSATVVRDLFKRSLVENHTPLQSKDDGIRFLGKNKKNILIIVHEPGSEFLDADDLAFLTGIISACRLSLDDIAIVNTASETGAKYHEIQSQLAPGKVIFFGVKPSALSFPMEFPEYKLQRYNNQQYLSAPELRELAADKAKKSQLWACLREAFSI